MPDTLKLATTFRGAELTANIKSYYRRSDYSDYYQVTSITATFKGKTKIFNCLREVGEGSLGHVYLLQEEGGQKTLACKCYTSLSQQVLDVAENAAKHHRLAYAENSAAFFPGKENSSPSAILTRFFPGLPPVYITFNDEGDFIDMLIACGKTLKKHCHKRNTVHGDLKYDNFLYHREKKKAYILDFDKSRKTDETIYTSQLQEFNAPETTPANTKQDIYSFGVMIFDLAKKIQLLPDAQYALSQLATRMQDPRPEKRPELSEVIARLEEIKNQKPRRKFEESKSWEELSSEEQQTSLPKVLNKLEALAYAGFTLPDLENSNIKITPSGNVYFAHFWDVQARSKQPKLVKQNLSQLKRLPVSNSSPLFFQVTAINKLLSPSDIATQSSKLSQFLLKHKKVLDISDKVRWSIINIGVTKLHAQFPNIRSKVLSASEEHPKITEDWNTMIDHSKMDEFRCFFPEQEIEQTPSSALTMQ
jgi:serine/threonine protein kinase